MLAEHPPDLVVNPLLQKFHQVLGGATQPKACPDISPLQAFPQNLGHHQGDLVGKRLGNASIAFTAFSTLLGYGRFCHKPWYHIA
jgi:hypothetical protein